MLSTSYTSERPLSLLVCCTPVHGHVTPVLAVVRVLEAALIDPDVGERVAAVLERRRQDMDSVIALLRDRGMCRSGRSDAELAAAVSFLISPESYAQLVLDSGWSRGTYLSWLVSAVERMILAP